MKEVYVRIRNWRATLKGLTIYGEQIARQGKMDRVQRSRRMADERILEVGQRGNAPQHCSNLLQLKAIKELGRYAEEMAEVKGVKEIDQILEASDVIRRMGQTWEMSRMRLMVSVGLGILQKGCRERQKVWR
ncbi:hypothetical protein [Hominifimenecus sp. rT4P-3]|uniref:hypothetical protein n=1 Tax=Hominifimenecus sp. rT4P-3 TaxID=3242979 RepID=UPI003DA1D74E